MSTQETIQKFIPANIIEHDTKPEYTLQDKLRNIIIREIRQEERDPNLYVIVQFRDCIFLAERMGYNINAQIILP